jgi:hypothetical protein
LKKDRFYLVSPDYLGKVPGPKFPFGRGKGDRLTMGKKIKKQDTERN